MAENKNVNPTPAAEPDKNAGRFNPFHIQFTRNVGRHSYGETMRIDSPEQLKELEDGDYRKVDPTSLPMKTKPTRK